MTARPTKFQSQLGTVIAVLALVVGSLIAAPAGPAQAAGDPCGPFDDVPASNVHCKNIEWLAESKITRMGSSREFKPTAGTTRGAMVTMLYRMTFPDQPQPKCTTKPFDDVPTDHKFCGTIQWAKTEKITTGIGDGKFGPADPVTRGAMVAFLHRATTGITTQPKCAAPPFRDIGTGHKFCGYIAWAKAERITTGVGNGCNFAPARKTTRGAMASFLRRLEVPGPAAKTCASPPERPTKQAVFSYGTLMKGQPAAYLMDGKYTSYAPSTLTKADLYYSASRAFPYAVMGGTGTIKGELYNLHDSTANSTITRLDAYERYDPKKPDSGQSYVRKQYKVQQGYTAWVYIAGPQQAAWLKSSGTLIPSGDWWRK